jgi:hypothetical protein
MTLRPNKELIAMSDNKKQTVMSRIKKWFFTAKILEVQGIPVGLSILMLLIIIMISVVLDIELPQKYFYFMISAMIFFLGLAGAIGIIRREFWWSRYVTLRGTAAVVAGIVTTFLGIGGALVMFIEAIGGQ